MQFQDLTTERHSAMNFEEGHSIPIADYKAIWDMVKKGPSAYNLQPYHFLIIDNQALKKSVFNISYKQHKLKTASSIVFVLANKEFVKDAKSIYEPMTQLGMIDILAFDTVIQSIEQNFSTFSEKDLINEATKNAMIAATSWLYASKEMGWDCCPMHVHNFDMLREICSIPDQYEPVLMVSMGKSYNKERARGFRKPFSQGCTINSFNK